MGIDRPSSQGIDRLAWERTFLHPGGYPTIVHTTSGLPQVPPHARSSSTSFLEGVPPTRTWLCQINGVGVYSAKSFKKGKVLLLLLFHAESVSGRWLPCDQAVFADPSTVQCSSSCDDGIDPVCSSSVGCANVHDADPSGAGGSGCKSSLCVVALSMPCPVISCLGL